MLTGLKVNFGSKLQLTAFQIRKKQSETLLASMEPIINVATYY